MLENFGTDKKMQRDGHGKRKTGNRKRKTKGRRQEQWARGRGNNTPAYVGGVGEARGWMDEMVGESVWV